MWWWAVLTWKSFRLIRFYVASSSSSPPPRRRRPSSRWSSSSSSCVYSVYNTYRRYILYVRMYAHKHTEIYYYIYWFFELHVCIVYTYVSVCISIESEYTKKTKIRRIVEFDRIKRHAWRVRLDVRYYNSFCWSENLTNRSLKYSTIAQINTFWGFIYNYFANRRSEAQKITNNCRSELQKTESFILRYNYRIISCLVII